MRGLASLRHTARPQASRLWAQRGLPTRREEAYRYSFFPESFYQNYFYRPTMTVGATAGTGLAEPRPEAASAVFRGRYDFVLQGQRWTGPPDGAACPARWSPLPCQDTETGPEQAGGARAIELLNRLTCETALSLHVPGREASDEDPDKAPAATEPARLHLAVVLGGQAAAGPDKTSLIAPRILLRLGPHAELVLEEAYLSDDPGADPETDPGDNPASSESPTRALGVPCLQIQLDSNAKLHHYVHKAPDSEVSLMRQCDITLGPGSFYCLRQDVSKASYWRDELTLHHTGEASSSDLYAVGDLYDGHQADLCWETHHKGSATRSSQHFRLGLEGTATGSVLGNLRVHAPGCEAHMLIRMMPLSSRVRMFTKPALDIRHDDVQCTHGATMGAPDPDVLFYMAQRGLTPSRALALLKHGFLRDFDDSMPEPLAFLRQNGSLNA